MTRYFKSVNPDNWPEEVEVTKEEFDALGCRADCLGIINTYERGIDHSIYNRANLIEPIMILRTYNSDNATG